MIKPCPIHVRSSGARYGMILGFFLMLALMQLQAMASVASGDSSYRKVVQRIQQMIEDGQLPSAQEVLLMALKKFPSNSGLENLLGVVSVEQGDVASARQEFTLAIQHDPSLTSAYLNLGRLLMPSARDDRKSRQQAVQLYESVLQQDPQNEDAHFELAILRMWAMQYQKSLDDIARLPEEARQDIRVQVLICADQAGLGNRRKEQREVAWLESSPDLTEQDVMLALPALRSMHQPDVIDELLTAVSGHHTLSVQGLRLLGLAEEAEGRLQSAQTTLERVYERKPSCVTPLVDLTRVALEEKQYQSALGYLAHARALQPDNAGFAYEFGLICIKLGLLNETIKAMHDAVQLVPNNAEYNLGMGIIASYGANPSEAIPYLQKYRVLRPEDPEGMLALGEGLFRLGSLEDASAWLSMAAKYGATEARARYYLGRILDEEGKYSLALEQLRQSVQAKDTRADVYAELGKAYMQLNKYGAAGAALHHALGLDANSDSANLALLRLYAFTHDPRQEEQRKRFLAVQKQKQNLYLDALRTLRVQPYEDQPSVYSGSE